MTRSIVADAIIETKIIAIIRERSEEDARREAERLLDAGIRVIEVSLSTPNALDAVRWMNDTLHQDGLHFGVGTVLEVDDVKRAADAQAGFIVSPISSTGMVEMSRQLGLVSVVGAMSPSECYAAASAGADFVKLFPARLWSPSGAKDLIQALPMLRLVPTGGVRLEDAAEWIKAGVVALGLGGALRSESSVEKLRGVVADVAGLTVGVQRA